MIRVFSRNKLLSIALVLMSVCACSVKPPEQVNFSVKGSLAKDKAPKLEYSIDTHPIGDVEADVSKAQSEKSKESKVSKDSKETKETAKQSPVSFGNTLLFKRGRYLPQNGGQNSNSSSNNQANNTQASSQYAPDRLARAAVIKSYAPVQVVPIGLDAFCKTAWMNGLLHVRVALLGPENNVKTFLQDYPNMKVTFRDESGNALNEYTLPASLFKKANMNTNYGTPTFEYEGQVAMPLEAYEQFWQWTLEWE
ncbi:MAG: hypothetical protein IPG59_22245 [Candidatus Melainabacteria bacterium]|nr:MAG: hypothetical protein IPG59_22245 [Candidatus Melainabacteria bacterium]